MPTSPTATALQQKIIDLADLSADPDQVSGALRIELSRRKIATQILTHPVSVVPTLSAADYAALVTWLADGQGSAEMRALTTLVVQQMVAGSPTNQSGLIIACFAAAKGLLLANDDIVATYRATLAH